MTSIHDKENHTKMLFALVFTYNYPLQTVVYLPKVRLTRLTSAIP